MKVCAMYYENNYSDAFLEQHVDFYYVSN